jgi:hypothetical protein
MAALHLQLDVTLSGNPVFTDTFSTGTLAGGSGAVLPARPTYSDGSTALYAVLGTLQETGTPPATKGVLDSAQGPLLTQNAPGFFPLIHLNAVTLLTGPPGSPFALTQTSAFATSGLFDVTVPATPGGFYQVELSDRDPSNNFLGDVISMMVNNCVPLTCPALAPGPYITLTDANAFAGTTAVLGSVPLDTSNQRILLELTKPNPLSDTVEGEYEYFNNGTGSGLHVLGSYSGLFTGPGTLDYTGAGFVQLAPVPEPSSLALLASSVFGLAWLRRRKTNG